MVYKFFGKKPRETTTHTETGIIFGDQQLANGTYKPINKNFKKHKYIHIFNIKFVWLILQACN